MEYLLGWDHEENHEQEHTSKPTNEKSEYHIANTSTSHSMTLTSVSSPDENKIDLDFILHTNDSTSDEQL